LLRVFLLTNERMTGTLGNVPWHAKTVWADRVAGAEFAKALTILAADFPTTPMWLTAFEDTASPRPGMAEVFFDPSKDQSVVHPPDIVYSTPLQVPVELAFLGAICLAVVGWAAWKEVRRATAK
jgi:hypothetical protein